MTPDTQTAPCRHAPPSRPPTRIVAVWSAVAIALSAGGLTLAAASPPPDGVETAGPATRTASPTTRPDGAVVPGDHDDPTQMDPQLKSLLERVRSTTAAPPPRAEPLPTLTLRGLVIDNTQPAAALLEIAGQGLVIVHAESSVTLTGMSGAPTMKVTRVSADGVEVIVPSVKGTILVH